MFSTPVQAANNQGLDWGVEVADRLEFSCSQFSSYEINTTTTTFTLDYDIYVDIDTCPDIDDNVDSLADIDFVSTTTKYALNDSAADDIFDQYTIPTILSAVVLPIGNWDAIAAAANNDIESTEGLELINNATHFGYGRTTKSFEVSYFKVDGSLALVSNQYVIVLFGVHEVHYDLVRTNPPDIIGVPIPETEALMRTSVAAVAIVIVVAILLKRK